MSLVGAAALRLRLWPLRVQTGPVRSFQWSGDTHYSVLGLQQDASPREIKAAYLALSKQLHPDLNQNMDDKTMFAIHQKYMRVMQAYAVLGTKKDRALYDLQLEGRRGPGGQRPGPAASTTKANTARFMSFEERAAAMGYHQVRLVLH
jgi:curved DNA-binding protein CbpA